MRAHRHVRSNPRNARLRRRDWPAHSSCETGSGSPRRAPLLEGEHEPGGPPAGPFPLPVVPQRWPGPGGPTPWARFPESRGKAHVPWSAARPAARPGNSSPSRQIPGRAVGREPMRPRDKPPRSRGPTRTSRRPGPARPAAGHAPAHEGGRAWIPHIREMSTTPEGSIGLERPDDHLGPGASTPTPRSPRHPQRRAGPAAHDSECRSSIPRLQWDQNRQDQSRALGENARRSSRPGCGPEASCGIPASR